MHSGFSTHVSCDILYPVFYVHTTYHAAYPPNPINFMKLQSYHANLIL